MPSPVVGKEGFGGSFNTEQAAAGLPNRHERAASGCTANGFLVQGGRASTAVVVRADEVGGLLLLLRISGISIPGFCLPSRWTRPVKTTPSSDTVPVAASMNVQRCVHGFSMADLL